MFNLKNHKHIDDTELLRLELMAFDIIDHPSGYRIKIGDEYILSPNLKEAEETLCLAIKELIEHLSHTWEELDKIANRIIRCTGKNSGSLDNLIFLNLVKKSFQLASIFSDLEFIQQTLYNLMDLDIKNVDDYLVRHFNTEALEIQSLHQLIMIERYRQKLIQRFMIITKQAQISGPWANLDLPMKERVWEWDEGEEEYFNNRRRSRRKQIRYNPENATKSGFYYVWQDLTRDPYLFENMKKDSPYKSRYNMTIP